MSDMFEVLFPVIVFFFIAISISKRTKDLQKKNQRKKENEAINRQVGITPAQSVYAANEAQRTAMQMTAMQRQAAQRPAVNRPAQQRPAGQPASAAAAVKKEEDLSTTEMLAEKARKDQIEHRKEEYEHKKHEQMYFGGYNYAKRYLLGDPVSATEKLIYCPNCAAENLLKLHENPAKYNCYFCREKLG